MNYIIKTQIMGGIKMIHSILLIGQSNMGGRGFKEEVPWIENDKILVNRNGRCVKCIVPSTPTVLRQA